jgi:LacI family transcriptional regulator
MTTHRKAAAPRVRLADVARRARVSAGTVSHVLTGHAQVSDALRERVQGAIDALGYVPNVHAQGLRRSRSRMIGLCMPVASTAYMSALSETLEDVASAAGYHVMHVFSRHDPATELDRIKDLVRYRADGLVLLPSVNPAATLDWVARKGVPLVVVDRPIDDRRFDQVALDNRAAMRDVAGRLVALGHRRIGFVCQARSRLATRHRIEGLQAACATAPGCSFDVVEFQSDTAFLRDEIARLLAQRAPPTAFVTSNSIHASEVLGDLASLGARIPEDVSVVTFDDPEWAMLTRPRLSVVRQPARAIARSAWDLLLQRISGMGRAPRTIALEATIELRASVAPPNAAREVVTRMREDPRRAS